ncbi:hypothetical protein K458DRAFT_417805 [Lentithecium fluviatile CBS 122367]|uniref:Uncharacterized protein n=1 Tax=Lentithecium fluviatile CBS 122367 TaxID=1168545 RepID=A0A6G1J415_9PLEO|nr:hypothetical protein K458DRAFT_417805 [Lentithecium fluviatile CBS 122367]
MAIVGFVPKLPPAKYKKGDRVLLKVGPRYEDLRVTKARLHETFKQWEYALDGVDRQLIAPEEALQIVNETRDFIEETRKSIGKTTRDFEGDAATPEPSGETSALGTVGLIARKHIASQENSVPQELENLRQRCDDLEAQIYQRQQQQNSLAAPSTASIAQFESAVTTPERKYVCKIWGSLITIYSFCSIALALGWGIPKHDPPGGATMAGWMIALGALMYAVFGKKHTSKCRCWGRVRGTICGGIVRLPSSRVA